MKIFMTGATGFIGTEVVKGLLAKGHEVVGLARSDRSADKLTAMGASAVRGTLDDVDVISGVAKDSDGVIHLGFTNDFSDMAGALAKDKADIKAIGDALVGTNKPFVNTSGTLMVVGLDRPATEADRMPELGGRSEDEALGLSYAEKGVRAMAVRLSPTVHNEQRQGIATLLAGMALAHGKVGYLNDGANLWPSVQRDDAAQLFIDALEKGEAGQIYNAVAEEGISVMDMTKTIAETLNLPMEKLDEKAGRDYFGWFYEGVQANNATSSEWTQKQLDWHPTGASLLDDLKTFLSNPQAVETLKQQS